MIINLIRMRWMPSNATVGPQIVEVHKKFEMVIIITKTSISALHRDDGPENSIYRGEEQNQPH
jgi:hypothetical protein